MEMLMIQENSRYKNNEILNTGGFSKSPVFVLKIKRVFSDLFIALIMLFFTVGCGDNKAPSVNGQDDKTGDVTEYVFGNDEPESEDNEPDERTPGFFARLLQWLRAFFQRLVNLFR